MIATTSAAASSPALSLFLRRRHLCFISCSLFRRRRRPPDTSFRTTKTSQLGPNPLHHSSDFKLRRFIDAATDAFEDLSTAVQVDRHTGRVFFSCRQSSLFFVGNMFICGFLAVLVFRFVVRLGLGFVSRLQFGGEKVVTRRDRSLGGREVVVARSGPGTTSRIAGSPVAGTPVTVPRRNLWKGNDVEKREELPDWWPVSSNSPQVFGDEMERLREQAQRLVRAITDYRMTGKDYGFDDILQLRKLCKASGAKVFFETENSRDSLYRAAINYVLDICSRAIKETEASQIESVQMNGEDVREFVSGLAENIGLKPHRAATLVRAGVAARTRACLLQCWALEAQQKRSEALEELQKICLILRIFPPEYNSPEMEMVANGLKKTLQESERERLLALYKGICPSDSHRAAAEALGFVRY
ncbi:Phosphoribosylformylglycinamidine synthase [Rhynchospora pubera]|uniref:Phosphoribosylformylglycinamidine synthase n=1 Tax=Rhynchospora pubera TaxID=906938 RepID=A0AAV8FUW5_9POAL|nr:Phosphoribosylformylglycinamidine synthase [Rhynchospora pubera]